MVAEMGSGFTPVVLGLVSKVQVGRPKLTVAIGSQLSSVR